MIACNINKDSYKYQALKKMSGISEFALDSTATFFMDKFGRLPELDELPYVNSEPYLREQLKIKTHSNMESAKIDDILEYTGADTIEEANVYLNNKHKDLEIEITPYSESAVITISHRPSEYKRLSEEEIEVEDDYNPIKSKLVLTEQLNRMRKLYGINIITGTTEDFKDIPLVNIGCTKGFVYNGQIYINTDNATIDTPVHEMLHIFLGAIRYSEPELYFQIVGTMETLSNYKELASEFPGRTRGDLNEEIFVQEFAKYLTNTSSTFDNLDISLLSKLFYNMYRNIDTLVSGNYSIKALDSKLNYSILELAKELQSDIVNNKMDGSLTPATIHRMLANFKEDLIKKGELKEVCDG